MDKQVNEQTGEIVTADKPDEPEPEFRILATIYGLRQDREGLARLTLEIPRSFLLEAQRVSRFTETVLEIKFKPTNDKFDD